MMARCIGTVACFIAKRSVLWKNAWRRAVFTKKPNRADKQNRSTTFQHKIQRKKFKKRKNKYKHYTVPERKWVCLLINQISSDIQERGWNKLVYFTSAKLLITICRTISLVFYCLYVNVFSFICTLLNILYWYIIYDVFILTRKMSEKNSGAC